MKFGLETILNILAVALLGAAAYFYSADEQDRLFACVVLAACSFFLGMRFRIKKNMAGKPSENEDKDITPTSD